MQRFIQEDAEKKGSGGKPFSSPSGQRAARDYDDVDPTFQASQPKRTVQALWLGSETRNREMRVKSGSGDDTRMSL